MTDNKRPESLEGRWDILYRDYPEVYEEWERIPIDYIREHNVATIRWKARARFKTAG